MSVGCEGGGDMCGYGEALVHVLVGVVRPSSRERPKREIELCGYCCGCVSGVIGKYGDCLRWILACAEDAGYNNVLEAGGVQV